MIMSNLKNFRQDVPEISCSQVWKERKGGEPDNIMPLSMAIAGKKA